MGYGIAKIFYTLQGKDFCIKKVNFSLSLVGLDD
jgi:hypothetical protein